MSGKSITEIVGWPLGIGVARTMIGTPLDRYAFEGVIQNRPIVRPPPGLWSGFKANLVRHLLKTPASFMFTAVVSHLVPTELSPSWRGYWIGLGVAGLETLFVINPTQVVERRRMQGEAYRTIFSINKFWTKGLNAALAHRTTSWTIYMSAYERLLQQFSGSVPLAATVAGLIQVAATSPLHAALVHQHKKGGKSEFFLRTIQRIYQEQGLRPLISRGIVPRSLQSVITSAPLMYAMEKCGVIQRKPPTSA
jgi:hypothetical protein